MKIIALGDTHGRGFWKNIIKENEYDKVIFIGDYWDSHDNISFDIQKKNFNEIVELKEKNKDKIILLIGNHDAHYLTSFFNLNEKYSNFQKRHAKEINLLFDSKLELFQACYMFNNNLFSHAGVTEEWLINHGYDKKETVDIFINNKFKFEQYFSFRFQGYDIYGDNSSQSPFWVRPVSLITNGFNKEVIRQIVGHTTMSKIEPFKEKFYFIDTLNTSGEYLFFDNDIISIKKMLP